MSKTGDSALLNLVDTGEEEISISSNMAGEDTFIDMNTDTEALLGDNSDSSPVKKESVFSFAYYQSLFDVDSDDIVQRLAWSSFPRPKFTSNFAKEKIKSKPDLYGPFWICVTLVFSIAIAGTFLINPGIPFVFLNIFVFHSRKHCILFPVSLRCSRRRKIKSSLAL